MKAILNLSRHHYTVRVSILLIMVALIVWMVGCGTTPVRYSLTLAVAPSSSGNATDLTNASPYTAGTVVNIKAVAAAGYQFVNWTAPAGTFTNASAAQTTFTMPAQNVTVTANFALQIRNWYDLDAIRNNLDGNYILMNNLDSTTAGYAALASNTANGGKGWEPIGNRTGGNFTGTFDGQGYVIKDLSINRPDEDNVGLFGFVNAGGVIKDIGVVNATVTGCNFTGGLVGQNFEGTVSNSHSTGSVTGSKFVGGLVGASGGTVSNSYSSGNVTGSGEQEWLFVGGLVGASNGTVSTVSNSYATGSVTGTGAGNYTIVGVGGLVGNNNFGTVSNSYATGNVTASGSGYSSCAGGLAGLNFNNGTVSNSYATGNVTGIGAGRYVHVGGLVGASNGTVSNSYSTGSVTGAGNYTFVGGLVGTNFDDGTVSNSYSTGNISGTWDVGGLVGYNFGTVSNSFWDMETSGQNASAGGTGENTTQMKDIYIFSGAGWDIVVVANSGARNTSYIWNIVDDVTYAFLSWQPV